MNGGPPPRHLIDANVGSASPTYRAACFVVSAWGIKLGVLITLAARQSRVCCFTCILVRFLGAGLRKKSQLWGEKCSA